MGYADGNISLVGCWQYSVVGHKNPANVDCVLSFFIKANSSSIRELDTVIDEVPHKLPWLRSQSSPMIIPVKSGETKISDVMLLPPIVRSSWIIPVRRTNSQFAVRTKGACVGWTFHLSFFNRSVPITVISLPVSNKALILRFLYFTQTHVCAFFSFKGRTLRYMVGLPWFQSCRFFRLSSLGTLLMCARCFHIQNKQKLPGLRCSVSSGDESSSLGLGKGLLSLAFVTACSISFIRFSICFL